MKTYPLMTAMAGAILVLGGVSEGIAQRTTPSGPQSPATGGGGTTVTTPSGVGARDPRSQSNQSQLNQNQMNEMQRRRYQNRSQQYRRYRNRLNPNQNSMNRQQLNEDDFLQSFRRRNRRRNQVPNYNPNFNPQYNSYLNQYYQQFQQDQYRASLRDGQSAGDYEREFSRIGDDDFQDTRDVNRFNEPVRRGNNNSSRRFGEGSFQRNPGSYEREFSRIGDDDLLDTRDANQYDGYLNGTNYGYPSPGLNVYDSQGNVRNAPPSTQGWR